MMENILSFLERNTEPWLSPALDFLDTIPSSIFMIGVVLLLLHLCCLVFKVFLSTLWKKNNIPKQKNKVKKRRSETCKGLRTSQRETQELKKLLSVVTSPLGQHQDPACLQQLLRPDNLCKIFNEVSHLLSPASLEDVASIRAPLESTGYVRKSSPSKVPGLSSVPGGELLSASFSKLSPPSPLTLSPNKVTPSADLSSPSPLRDSLPPEPLPPLDSKSPVDFLPPPSPSLPLPPPHHTQEAETLLPQDTTLPVVSSPAGLSTSVPMRNMDHTSTEPPAKKVISSNLAQDGVKQQFLALHSQNLSGGDIVACHIETTNIRFLPPAVLSCLERQTQKKADVLKWKEMGKKAESFPKPLKPNDQGFSSGKRSESVADQQDSSICLLSWDKKDKSEELQVNQQSLYPKSFEDHLQQNYTQLFCGIPSLHPKSLNPTVPASGDCSSAFVCYNTSSNASIAQESQVLPHAPPVFLPLSHPKPLPKTLSQPHPQHLSPVHAQTQCQLQSSLSILLSPPKNKFRICGVCDLGPQNEALSLVPSEIHNLEYNVLQKTQESLWGLPSVVRKSQEDFCPPAPNILLVNRSSKPQVPISILPGDFPLSNDVQKKLDHHLRKMRIQHLWGLPRRVYASLSLMRPVEKTSETSESKSSLGLSRKSLVKSQSTKDINKGSLSQPQNLHDRRLGMFPLEVGERKTQRNGIKIDQNGHVVGDLKMPDNVLGSSSRNYLKRHLQGPSGGTSRISMVNPLQKQLEHALNIHLNKKFEEISEGHIPATVHRSWHSIKLAVPVTEKSTTQKTHKPLAPTRMDISVNTTQEIFFLDAGQQKMMEDHITLFHKRLIYGLPNRVQESLGISNENDSHSSFAHSKFPSSATLNFGVDSKKSISKTLGGRSNVFHGDKDKIKNSVPTLDCPLPATSTIVKQQHVILTPTVVEIKHEHAEDLHRAKDGKPSLLPQTQSIIGKAYQKPPVAVNRCSPKLPMRQAGAGPQETHKRLSSTYCVERPQGKRMTWGSSSMSKVSKVPRETLKAQELCACQSLPISVPTVRKSESSPVPDVYTPEHSPRRTSIVRDPELCGEVVVKMKKEEHSQDQDHRNGMPLVSNNLTSKTDLRRDQGTASKNMAVSQVLHVHLDNTPTSTEHGQGPWVPKLSFHKGQDKNCPETAKRMTPLGSKPHEFGGGDAGLGTCLPRKMSQALGRKSCSAQSLKAPPPTESFRNQMKHFFQCLFCSTKDKRKEGSLEKGSSPSSPVQGRGLVRRRAAFTGNSDNPQITRDYEKVQEEKRGHKHGVDVICPQEPHLSPMKSGKTQPKAGLQVQAESIQVHPFNYQSPCSIVRKVKSCRQESGLAGQSYPTRNKQIRDLKRESPKVEAFRDQKQSPCMPHRDPKSHLSLTCGHQVGQMPVAAPAPSEVTVLGDLSLISKEKIIIQSFHRGKIPSP